MPENVVLPTLPARLLKTGGITLFVRGSPFRATVLIRLPHRQIIWMDKVC